MRFLLSFLFAITAQAAWTTNSTLTMSDTGISATGSDQIYQKTLYYLTNGEPRVIYGFTASGHPSQSWDFGLSNSVSRVVDIKVGYLTANCNIPCTNNLVVIGTITPGYLVEYNPADGTVTDLVTCWNDGYYSANADPISGTAFFGTYGDGIGGTNSTAVDTYNPATRTVTQWGSIGFTNTHVNYVQEIGGDADFIYAHINDTTWSRHYVGIIRRSDSYKVQYWTNTVAGMRMAKGTADNDWYIGAAPYGVAHYYKFSGTNEPIEQVGTPSIQDSNIGANRNTLPETWETEEGWEVEPTFAVSSVAGSIPQSSVRFRKTGTTPWTTIVETNGWLLGPYTFRHLVPYSSSMIWHTREYGPIGFLDSANTVTLSASQTGLSLYKFLVVDANNVYMSGYHDKTKRWNPATSWTWTPSTDDTNTSVNPYLLQGSLGNFHYYNALASNGRIYVAGQLLYASSQGVLGWFDQTNQISKDTTTWATHGKPNDLTPAEGGTKMLWASNQGDGKIYKWDVSANTLDTSFSPLGTADLDKIIEYESGKIYGIGGASDTIHCAFTTAGSLIWSNNLPASAWGGRTAPVPLDEHRLNLGPDGYIWQIAGGILYRINPQDGGISTMRNATNNYNTVFNGGNLYIYGGDYGSKIWKISDALISDNAGNSATAVNATVTHMSGQ